MGSERFIRDRPECVPVPDKPLTVRYLSERLNQFLDDSTAVLADPGDAMFAGIDMTIHCASEFSSPAYYTSLGYAVPAAIGVQLARPDLRPLVLVGDGAFQMPGMESSTGARFGLTPIVAVSYTHLRGPHNDPGIAFPLLL